jgi:actin-related protein
MFEKFNVPNTTSVPKSVLPLYSHGKVTGLVVDSGYEYTHVVPIEGGYPVAHGVRNMPIGGWHVTQYMKQLINERGYDWKTSKDIDVVTIIKEKFGYCSLDVEKDQAMFTEDMEQNYTLPDGMIFKVKSEK